MREGYSPPPFVFEEEASSGESRLVAWTGNMDQLQKLFHRLLSMLPDPVEVLFKVESELRIAQSDDDGSLADVVDRWDRYFGGCRMGVVLRATGICNALIFQDSRCQLLVRDPGSHDYLVLDEVGVIYVYSDDVRFRDACVAEGFEQRPEELIRAQPHWRHCVKDGAALSRRFVRELGLQRIDSSGAIVPIDTDNVQ
jgi:hypothetical protein